MSGDYDYLLTALPGLDELGSTPPISPAKLLEMVINSGSDPLPLETVLLSDDLLQRQAFLSGEIDQAYPTILTLDQTTNNAPLPGYIESYQRDLSDQAALDTIWESYFRYAESVAISRRSSFLSTWLAYEIGLRNALARARAKALKLDPQEYVVAESMEKESETYSPLISEWAAASNPLAGLRILDEARWKWVWEHDRWFTFQPDEVVAYGAKLMLLYRWYLIEKELHQN